MINLNSKENIKNMKKICSFLICFLLAILALTPLVTKGGENLDTIYADGENQITVSSASELRDIATKVNSGEDTYSGKTILLDKDLLDVGTWTPIGQKGAPFKGVFDGQGHTISGISVTDGQTYQGLFGYASGATIKNVCVKDFSSTNLYNADGVYVGSILGAGIQNTTIESCEVDSSASTEAAYEIVCNSAVGGVVGYLDGGRVTNTSSFMNVYATYNLRNEYTIKIGGFAGRAENSIFVKASSFGGVKIEYSGEEAPTLDSKFYVGGFAGEISGNSTQMFDGVVGGVISARNNYPDTQTMVVGSVAGALIDAPATGKMTSIAYTQTRAAFGQNDSGYLTANNYIMQVSEGLISAQAFYQSDSYTYDMNGAQYTFVWSQGTDKWDFDSVWVMANDKLRLQLFQFFDLSLADFLDNDGLLERTSVAPTPADPSRKPYAYNEIVNMSVKFKNIENNKYYDVSDILLNGQSLNLSEFIETTSPDYGTVKTSKTGEIAFYKDGDTFHLDVKATNSTEGNYSFRLKAIEYKVYIMSDENGAVRYSGASTLAQVLTRDMSASSNQISIEAVSNKKYKFNGWSIYYEDATAGDKEYDQKLWKKQSISLPGTNPLAIKFADGAYNQNFLLMANFVLDPCTFSFAFDSSMIAKITVNNADVVSSSGETVTLDKNEAVSIKVFVKEEVEFDSENLEQVIKSFFSRDTLSLKLDTYKDSIDSTLTVYEYTFSTSSLDYGSASTFNFSLTTKIAEKEKDPNTTLYIVLGSVGGALLLAGIGITIWLVMRKKAYGKAAASKDDYKNFYY